MKLYNLQHPQETVTFAEAVRTGMGRGRGLYFPVDIPRFAHIEEVLGLSFVERSKRIVSAWLGDELEASVIDEMIDQAFNFAVEVKQVDENRAVCELFHGPTLAFKDFGARFMAQCLKQFSGGRHITILTATSGDTGAAVAHAFYNIPGISVVVLYPAGKISPLQEKLFCTLGGNVRTLAVDADFDACQELVKKAFVDDDLQKALCLNSANSINISRILAQTCYYFEAVAAVKTGTETVVAVPSGNFGNLTAGLMAKAMGLPIKRFIAATNVNDTVPRYLQTGVWAPAATVPTSSNAMDVSAPSNWPRVEAVIAAMKTPLAELVGVSVNEKQTVESLLELNGLGYLAEPHTAIAAAALRDNLRPGETGIFLATAHPAKFRESVEAALQIKVELPPALRDVAEKQNLSLQMNNEFSEFKKILLP